MRHLWEQLPLSHPHFWILPALLAAILGVLTLLVSRSRLRHVYESHFPDPRRERLFLSSIGFFTTVVVIRGITLAIHYKIGPFHDISMGGRHIHHLVWGILLLLLVGYGWLLGAGVGDGRWARWGARLLSMLYGIGAALALDEFALWLNLRDVYWDREGRESFEAMALFGGLLAIGIFGRRFFQGVGKELVTAGSGKR